MEKAQISRIYQTIIRNKWSFFLLWSLWLTLEYFGFGPFSYVQIHDFGDIILPTRLALMQGFLENGFSYWFPMAAGGVDRLAVTQLNIFQIDSLFFLAFPAWFAYGLVTFLQRFLAGYFTYRLCKDYLKLGELPSLIAGLAYSITFFYFQTQFAGEAGFPLILWSLEYISERKNVSRYILAFLLGLFVLFSSSFPLSIPFILPMALAWFVLVRRKYSFHFLSLFIIFSITILIGKIPIIWALLVNAPLSHLADWQPAHVWAKTRWQDYTSYVFNFLKANIIYLSLGALGLYWSRLKERSLLIVMLLLGFCGILSRLWKPLARYFHQYMGFLTRFQFDRFYLLAPFFVVIAAAYGLHLLYPNWVSTQDNSHNKRKYRVQTILCILFIGFLVFNSFSMKYSHGLEWHGGPTSSFDINSYAINYENPDLQHIAADTDSPPFRVGTVAHGLHPAYANAYGLETVDGYLPLYPQRYQDFWGEVIGPLISKDGIRGSYFRAWGSRIYLFSRGDESFDTIEEVPFAKYYNLNLLSLANTRYLISLLPLSHEHLKLLPSQIPYYYEVKAQGTLSKVVQAIKRNIKGRRLYIYENETFFPRFFLSGKAIVFEDSNQLLEAMAEADINSLRNNVFVEEKFLSEISLERLGFTDGELTIEQYSPDRIILSVDLDKPGILVASNNYNPYWICKINGVEKNIFPAYHTFMGVFVLEGESRVELEYRPPYRAF